MTAYIQLLRPPQWIKNLFVFAALVFGGKVSDSRAVLLSLIAFAAFCMVSSAGYVFNDILDRERDRLHPKKKDRPIASGAVPVGTAGVIGAALLVLAVMISFVVLPVGFRVTLLAYFVLTVTYSVALKHRVILDVIVIAVLFVLRAMSGAYAIDVPVSEWLLVCTFMLCLFLGFGKRRCEIAMIANARESAAHRSTLERYTPEFLTHLLSTSGGVAVITFLLYTLDRSSHRSVFDDRKQYLVYTLPLVTYGIYRYAMLIEQGKATGPTDLIIKDPPFVGAILLWIIAAGLILYARSPLAGG